MTISDDHVLMLRGMLIGDAGLYEEVAARLQRANALDGYALLVAAAFYEAAHHRFGKGYTATEMIRFVADQRIRFMDPDVSIDPVVAEALLVAALSGGPAVEGVDERAKGAAEIVLLSGLVADEDFDDAGLAEFLRRARQTAETVAAAAPS